MQNYDKKVRKGLKRKELSFCFAQKIVQGFERKEFKQRKRELSRERKEGTGKFEWIWRG